MNSISQLDHEGEFQRAWADPSNTRFEHELWSIIFNCGFEVKTLAV